MNVALPLVIDALALEDTRRICSLFGDAIRRPEMRAPGEAHPIVVNEPVASAECRFMDHRHIRARRNASVDEKDGLALSRSGNVEFAPGRFDA